MDGYQIYPDPALRGKTPWAVVASSLWLRLGFVAACEVVVALTELYQGANPLVAVAWTFGGAWVAALSWRRAKFLLDQLDAAEAATQAAVSSDAIGSTEQAQPTWDRRDVVATSAASHARG
jgi:hypothetical protein